MKFLFLQDLILTPIYLIPISALVLRQRQRLSTASTAPYFAPAFGYKILGGIMLGLIYQFYYGGGDTFYYYRDGAFMAEQPLDTALMLIFRDMEYIERHFRLTHGMVYFGDDRSFMISRLSGFCSLLSFGTYTVNAMLFATYSFFGSWRLFMVLQDRYPDLHRSLAIATLFVPSTFFWGGGLLKDSISFGAMGFMFYHFYFALIKNERRIVNLGWLALHASLLLSIKPYIAQLMFPAIGLWLFLHFQSRIPGAGTRYVLGFIQVLLFAVLAYFAVQSIGDDLSARLDEVGKRAKITADWIRTVSSEGSYYTLGEMDGSFGSMISLAPQAILTTLFRPGIWEVTNPLMLLSALENTVIAILIIQLLFKLGVPRLFRAFSDDSYLVFALAYTLAFGFLVGVTSSNFGTLVRYKIPMMPFFVSLIFILRAKFVAPAATATQPRRTRTSAQKTDKRTQPKPNYTRLRDRSRRQLR